MSDVRDRIANRRAELAAAGDVKQRVAKRRAELAGTTDTTGLPEGYSVIATTKDGGRVYQKPDGTQGFVGPAMSTENPETVARILEGATPAQAYRGEYQEEIIAGNPVAARGAKFVQGVPFAGQYVDEAIGKVAGPEAQSGVRALQDAMDEERPGQAMALEMSGAVVGSAPLVAAAGPTIMSAAPASTAGQVATATGAGIVGGGVESAVSGYGRGRTPEERQRMALKEGVLGATLGGALGLAGPPLAKAGANLVRWVKTTDVAKIASELGISKKAAAVLRSAIDADDAADAVRRVQNVGDEAMLADAGPASAQLLDTAMAAGGEALATGRRAIDERAARTTPMLRKAFDTILGAPKGLRKAARDTASKTAATRKAAYKTAYSQPINYASPKGMAIEGVLARVPDDQLRGAVKLANDAMKEAGERNKQILLDLDTGDFIEMPNVQQLDYLKRALGEVAENNKDAKTGILNGAGLRAQRLARDLKNAVVDAVPTYGRAVKLGGDNIADRDALSLGRSVLTRHVKLEDVTETMAGASKTQKTAFKQGLREAIEDTMDNVRSVLSDPNGDAREAAKIWGDLSSKATRKKIDAAIGKAAAKRIFDLMEKEFPMLQTRSAVARGSQTAIRTAGRESIDEMLTPGVVGKAARGEPVDAGRRVIQALTNTTPQADQAERARILAEVAEALTKTRGAQAEQALNVVRGAMRGQAITEDQARMVGRLVGSGVVLGGYQSGKQVRARQ